MYCKQCGAETVGENEYCESCQTPVRVLSPEEREGFDGLTIVESEEEHRYESKQQWEPGPKVYVHQIKGSFWTWLIFGAIILTILVFALPLALFIICVSLVSWLFRRLISR